MNKFLLIFSLVLTTSYAQAAKRIRCVSLLNNDSEFQEALARTEGILKKYFGQDAKVILTELPNTASEEYPYGVEIDIQIGQRTYPLKHSYFGYNIEKGKIKTTVNIEEEFQKKGLNTLLQTYVLSRHPEVHTLDDSLIEDNYKGFLSHFFARKKKPDFNYEPQKKHKDKFYKLLSTPEGKKELRELAIKAFREYTAAGKLNARLGIEDLTMLRLDFRTGTIYYTAKKGSLNDETVEVSVVDDIGFTHKL